MKKRSVTIPTTALEQKYGAEVAMEPGIRRYADAAAAPDELAEHSW